MPFLEANIDSITPVTPTKYRVEVTITASTPALNDAVIWGVDGAPSFGKITTGSLATVYFDDGVTAGFAVGSQIRIDYTQSGQMMTNLVLS